MGWFGKSKDKKSEGKGKQPPAPELSPREKLKQEALANARAARERLGDETIQKIADALRNESAGKQARDKIREMDKGRVADHLRSLIEDK